MMMIEGTKHTEQTRKKMSDSQKARFANESAEKKEQRRQAIINWHKKVDAMLRAEYEERQRQAHKEFVISEYNRLKEEGEID